MRRRFLSVAALIFAAACSVADNPTITEPTIERPLVASPVVVQSCAVTFTQLQNQVVALFTDGSSDESSALSKLNSIQQKLTSGDIASARSKAWDLASFIQSKKTKNTFLGDDQEISAFINALLCFVGYGPNAFLIFPSDLAQTLTTNDSLAGVQVPANNVAVPTLLVINPLTSAPPLVTKLDIYPLYYDFAITNEAGAAGAWLAPVTVGVCASADTDVLQYLLLGHQSDTGFELLEPEPVPFLACSSAGGSPNVVMNLAGDNLIAAAVIGSAGVGGSTDDFSPIAPVDGRVVGSSGAGGGADDFRPRRGMTPSMNLVSLPTIVCTEAAIGTEVDPACRPLVTFATPGGTEMTVPVDWAVESGGGSIANPPSCSPFQSSLTQNTDAVTGVTTVCWKLGPAVGTNTVTAKGQVGGDAPLGVKFIYNDGGLNGIRFTVTGIQLDPGVTATGASGTYTGSAFTGSGTCSPNPPLTPVLSYKQNGQPVGTPVNVGTYELTVTCGVAGDPGDIYTTQTATAAITIAQATSSTTLTCPASVQYNGSAQTPCTLSVSTSDGLSPSVTVNYTNNTNAGTANASASYAGDANHAGSSDSKSFTITQATSTTTLTCPASVLYNGSAQMPCTLSVSTSDGLSPSVTVNYTNNTNAGTANASATYAGDANHVSSNDSKSFTINQRSATATAGSATIQFGSPVPAIPCTVTGLLPADAGSVTCTTSTPTTTAGVNPTIPVVSPASPTNYNVTPVNGTLTVTGFVQVGCFASPIFNVMPDTKSAQNKGSNLPVKCTLQWPNGTKVATASASLDVWDLGLNASFPAGSNPTPSGTPTTILNAFTPTANGNYSYALSTNNLLIGHAYFIKARWNDGSVTNGYFRIK